jgi:hypothetical protein
MACVMYAYYGFDVVVADQSIDRSISMGGPIVSRPAAAEGRPSPKPRVSLTGLALLPVARPLTEAQCGETGSNSPPRWTRLASGSSNDHGQRISHFMLPVMRLCETGDN